MSESKNYFTCKSVRFFCLKDEDAFFEWIKKIDCIKSFEGAGNELYLDLVDRDLSSDDIHEIAALFKRYKIDMKQIADFYSEDNKTAFSVWKKEIYG